MKERDYILAANIARLRIADGALRDVLVDGILPAPASEELRDAIAMVGKLIRRHEKAVRVSGA